MKSFVVILLIAASVHVLLPAALATKTTTDGRLTISSEALGALVIATSSCNFVDAVPGRRRRRRRRRCFYAADMYCL